MTVNLQNAEFFKSAGSRDGFIRDRLPKIAFAGRSNVGKSSTINALLNRKSIARVSESPGKTANVNYYTIDKKLYFIDLPGYGFARVSKQERDRWGRLMEEFFTDTEELSLCVLLVDMRHRPTADDLTMCDFFRGGGLDFIVAANKLDAVKKLERAQNIIRIRETLGLAEDIPVLPYSAKKRENIENLKGIIQSVWEAG
ncbi:MAG: ribosome biogenesis GTP-binding protein YihA/YsxC [Oscillospiraceae bacterium]|jgi:GTP-binding protein|nr:ribosome biogenesis GTP-binding protein YihA/YsxC [Oscillospiraceae bacterium]